MKKYQLTVRTWQRNRVYNPIDERFQSEAVTEKDAEIICLSKFMKWFEERQKFSDNIYDLEIIKFEEIEKL